MGQGVRGDEGRKWVASEHCEFRNDEEMQKNWYSRTADERLL